MFLSNNKFKDSLLLETDKTLKEETSLTSVTGHRLNRDSDLNLVETLRVYDLFYTSLV